MGKLNQSQLDSYREIDQILSVNLIPGMDNINISEGVMYVITQGEALWLVGSIAALQAKISDDFQLWQVEVNKDLSAELTCKNRHGKSLISKSIAKVIEFGLPELKLCVVKPPGGNDFMITLPREANNYYGDKLAPLL